MLQINLNQPADIETTERTVGSPGHTDEPTTDARYSFETDVSSEPHIVCGALAIAYSVGLIAAYYSLWGLRYSIHSLISALLSSTFSVAIITCISIAPSWLMLRRSVRGSNYRHQFLVECATLALLSTPLGLLLHLNSPLLSITLILSAAVAANSLRYLLPTSAPPINLDTDLNTGRSVNLICSLEPSPINRTAVALSIVAQLAIVTLLAGHAYLSIILFCILSFTSVRELAIRFPLKPRKPVGTQGLKRVIIFSVYSVTVVYIILIPSSQKGPLISALRRAMTSSAKALPRKPTLKTDNSERSYNGAYESIILWPPKKPHEAIRMPSRQSIDSTSTVRSNPLLILFDGPYWYYKAPATAPDSRARVVHGDPVKVDIHSADRNPLKMEARQPLMSPLSISCCSRLEVALTNADNREGSISLVVALSDSTKFRSTPVSLGSKIIPSSAAAHISLRRPPVNEVLDFPIPHTSANYTFDTVRLIFIPERSRFLAGERISIQTLRFIP